MNRQAFCTTCTFAFRLSSNPDWVLLFWATEGRKTTCRGKALLCLIVKEENKSIVNEIMQ
jgi:hypothetical protein